MRLKNFSRFARTSIFLSTAALALTVMPGESLADTYFEFDWARIPADSHFSMSNVIITVNSSNKIINMTGTVTWIDGVSPPNGPNDIQNQAITSFTDNNNNFNGIGSTPFFSGTLNFNVGTNEFAFDYSSNRYKLSLINPDTGITVNGGISNFREVPEIDASALPKAALLLGSLYLVAASRRNRQTKAALPQH